MKKINALIHIILVTVLLACKQKSIDPCSLSMAIGNGLTMHPQNNTLLISTYSKRLDKNNKNQYNLYEVVLSEQGDTIKKALSINSEYSDYHPIFSQKGDFILFNSTRPKPNQLNSNGKTDIYLSKYENNDFSSPEYLKNINTDFHDSYPSLTRTNKLYFNSDRPGGKGMMDVYVSENKKGDWQKPSLVAELNSEHSENDMVVDPEERFIIFNRYISQTNEIDLFVSYKINGKWSSPSEITKINKQNVWELTPTLSLNGEYLYLEINGKIECYPTSEFLKNE